MYKLYILKTTKFICKVVTKWYNLDNTYTLLYYITTNFDIATIHADNFMNFGMKNINRGQINSINILEGQEIKQESFDMYQSIYQSYDIISDYNFDKKSIWKNLYNENIIHITGRIIGGNLESITKLIGTRYDNTRNYIEKYKNDGIVWYLESFSMNTSEVYGALWEMKESGYFKYTSGFIFGRPAICENEYNITYEETLKDILGQLHVPIADIYGETKCYKSFSKSIYIKFIDFIQKHFYKGSIDLYDNTNKKLLAKYKRENAPDGEIRFLAANPNLKIKGIGTMLLQELEKREKGKEVYLFTDDQCTYQFYEHRGFEKVGEKDIVLDLNKKIPLKCLLYRKKL